MHLLVWKELSKFGNFQTNNCNITQCNSKKILNVLSPCIYLKGTKANLDSSRKQSLPALVLGAPQINTRRENLQKFFKNENSLHCVL